ncbi:MAG: hypothetical protein WBB27_12750 [Maribacter sp.]
MKGRGIVILLFSCILWVGCKEKKSENLEVIENTNLDTNLVEHGKYMVNVLGCADCHTPKKMT